MRLLTSLLAVFAATAGSSAAFDVSCNSNYASYYGQNSARNQQSLGEYCKDATEDLIVLAFMNGFPNIILNFANACETTFEGSTLLHCPNIASDIKYCQSKGKAVILSMGGASGAYGFSGDSDAIAFADTAWNMFFKGKSDKRPFDDAVLDGIDLDIEGGSGAGYPAFINQLRSHYASDPSKKYYIAAAPQCPYPDSYLGTTLNSAWFDMVYVQFYNNFCGLNAYPTWFNFADWDNWAKTKSLNKDVKVYIGAPGSPSAASSGYVDGATLTSIYNDVRSKYSSLGGIMTWDVSQARTSGIAKSIRAALDAGGTCKHDGVSGGASLSKRLDFNKVSLITRPNLRPKPMSAKSNRPTRVEFVAGDITDNKYSTVVKIQTNKNAFTGDWSFSFTLPEGQTVESTSRGAASINNNAVTIKSDPSSEDANNMAAIFKIVGTFKGTYALPETNSAVFSST
ncbi:Chitinase 2 [Coemansia sp. RSA 518]|nr:Chitinase 2 [Coemansia sp. RSA 532]KAJ2225606.1 Chitinase 2 [Coemansia sp. RSA 518]